MFQITINEKGGAPRNLDFDKNEITIGRVQGNDIVLPKGNISKRHSRIVLKDGKFIIIDMQSTNGTYVNGKKITQPQVVKASDKIYIGDFTLQLASGNGVESGAPQPKGQRAASMAPQGEVDLDVFDEKKSDEGRGAPGLVDDNFDKEFDGVDEPAPEPVKAAPAKVVAPQSKKPAKPEPEPEPEPDLDLDVGNDDSPGGGAATPAPNLSMNLDDDGEGSAPKAPVVPMKSPPKKQEKTPSPSPAVAQARPGMSKLKPVPGAATAKPSKREEDEELPRAASPSPRMPSAPPATNQNMSAPQALSAVMAPSLPPMERRVAVREIHRVVVEELGLAQKSWAAMAEAADDADKIARRALGDLKASHHVAGAEDAIVADVVSMATDFSAIAELMEDATVAEIVIAPSGKISVERDGHLTAIDKTLSGEHEIVRLIDRLAVLGNVPTTAESQVVDARLRDGTRVLGSVPPLAFRGPTLSIRKTLREAFTLDSLVETGALSDPMRRFLNACLLSYKRGILLSLGPGVGASASLNALASVALADERVVGIEASAELHKHEANLVSFEPSAGLPFDRLVRHVVSLQPDRVFAGVMSGPESFDLVAAAAGPLEGMVACYAAGSVEQALDRLSHDLVARVGSAEDAKRLVARAFPVIVHEQRFSDGSRRLTKISEVHLDGDAVAVDDVFVFEVEGLNESGYISGEFKATGYVPRFVEELPDRDPELKDLFTVE